MFFERRCPVCGVPHPSVCEACRSRMVPGGAIEVPGLDAVLAMHRYDPVSRALVVTAKNFGRRDLLRTTGVELAELSRAHDWQPEVVTFVPATAAHRRERGFDQGRVLAKSVARSLGVPSRSLLRRRGGSQQGKNRTDRLDGPEMASRTGSPARVLLVDDVVTTGASLESAARALREAGATSVFALTIAASVASGDIKAA